MFLVRRYHTVAGSDDTSASMGSVSDSQTADADGGGQLKTKMQSDFNKKKLENFVMQFPLSPVEFCISHSFLMWNPVTQALGIDIFPPDHRYLAFRPGVCFGFLPTSVAVGIKVTQEQDMYEGGFIARKYGLSTKKTLLSEFEFNVAITYIGVDLSVITSSNLVRTADTWLVNPWGILPKVAVLFPQTMAGAIPHPNY